MANMRIEARFVELGDVVDGLRVEELSYDNPSAGRIWVSGPDTGNGERRILHWPNNQLIEVDRGDS